MTVLSFPFEEIKEEVVELNIGWPKIEVSLLTRDLDLDKNESGDKDNQKLVTNLNSTINCPNKSYLDN